MLETAATPAAYELLHHGALALAQATRNGIRLDVDYIKQAKETVKAKVSALEEKANDDEVSIRWRKMFGQQTNIQSREQLGKVLTAMGHVLPSTKTGRARTDKKAFDDLDIPYTRLYKRIAEWKKLSSTYLDGFEREAQWDGMYWLVHPFFNLHTVRTYRSSSDSPNFQNITNRDKELAEMIRRAFIPRDGYMIGEFDFKSLEVNVGCPYHHDKQMILYCKDPVNNDMHRDMCKQLFKLEDGQWTKQIRNAVKALFVFSEFYGNYFKNTARDLWDIVDREKLTIADGTLLRDHLRSQGFRALGACDKNARSVKGTYEHYVQSIEEDFWGRRFATYAAWKKSWYAEYQKTGGFSYLTGFRVEGILDRKQVTNFPIQGTAFHCLLWTLIKLQRWLTKNNMKSLIIGQIHDSIIMDLWIPEVDRVKRKIKQLVTERLPEHWKWINVPLTMECEIAPENGSWFDKKAVSL